MHRPLVFLDCRLPTAGEVRPKREQGEQEKQEKQEFLSLLSLLSFLSLLSLLSLLISCGKSCASHFFSHAPILHKMLLSCFE